MPGFVFDDPSIIESTWNDIYVIVSVLVSVMIVLFWVWKTRLLRRVKAIADNARDSIILDESSYLKWMGALGGSRLELEPTTERKYRAEFARLPLSQRWLYRDKESVTRAREGSILLGAEFVLVAVLAYFPGAFVGTLVTPLYHAVTSIPTGAPEEETISELSNWLYCNYALSIDVAELRDTAWSMLDIERGSSLPSSIAGWLASSPRPLSVPHAPDGFLIRSESGVWMLTDAEGVPIPPQRTTQLSIDRDGHITENLNGSECPLVGFRP